MLLILYLQFTYYDKHTYSCRSHVQEFIANPNAIILAVTAANQDLANSDGLKMARSVGNYQVLCMYVCMCVYIYVFAIDDGE